MRRRILSGATLLVAASLALACGKKDVTPRADSVNTSTGEAAVVRVASIDIGKSLTPDKTIATKTDTFAKTDTIFASIETAGSGVATVAAKWTFQDGQVVDESTQSISPVGPAHTEFHIVKPSGWPVGKYHVEITINGTSAGTKDFEVK
jgi:hypothetical protein